SRVHPGAGVRRGLVADGGGIARVDRAGAIGLIPRRSTVVGNHVRTTADRRPLVVVRGIVRVVPLGRVATGASQGGTNVRDVGRLGHEGERLTRIHAGGLTEAGSGMVPDGEGITRGDGRLSVGVVHSRGRVVRDGVPNKADHRSVGVLVVPGV